MREVPLGFLDKCIKWKKEKEYLNGMMPSRTERNNADKLASI